MLPVEYLYPSYLPTPEPRSLRCMEGSRSGDHRMAKKVWRLRAVGAGGRGAAGLGEQGRGAGF